MAALGSDKVDVGSELTYAKEIFTHNESETKISSLGWNKNSDKISVIVPSMWEREATKGNIFSKIVSVHDPISLISPAHVLGKLLYHVICDTKLSWDETVPPMFKQKWKRWKLDK